MRVENGVYSKDLIAQEAWFLRGGELVRQFSVVEVPDERPRESSQGSAEGASGATTRDEVGEPRKVPFSSKRHGGTTLRCSA